MIRKRTEEPRRLGLQHLCSIISNMPRLVGCILICSAIFLSACKTVNRTVNSKLKDFGDSTDIDADVYGANDPDRDGIPYPSDLCDGTPQADPVGEDGCSLADSDEDG